MYQLVDHIIRIGKIAENTCARGAGGGTGGELFSFGEPLVPAEVALVDGPVIFAEIAGVIGAGQHAGLAAYAFFVLHHDDAGDRILVGCLGRTAAVTGRVVAVVAEHRYEFHLFVQSAWRMTML